MGMDNCSVGLDNSSVGLGGNSLGLGKSLVDLDSNSVRISKIFASQNPTCLPSSPKFSNYGRFQNSEGNYNFFRFRQSQKNKNNANMFCASPTIKGKDIGRSRSLDRICNLKERYSTKTPICLGCFVPSDTFPWAMPHDSYNQSVLKYEKHLNRNKLACGCAIAMSRFPTLAYIYIYIYDITIFISYSDGSIVRESCMY